MAVVDPSVAAVDDWPPPVLTAAVAVVAFETAAEIVLIAADDGRTVALRVALAASLALKLVFAGLLVRRSAGALLGLMLWEVTALLVAVAATEWHAGLRIGLTVTAVVALVLLGAVARRFPSPSLPPVTSVPSS